MNNTHKALNYYKAGAMQNGKGPWPKPQFIPAKVFVLFTVHGDGPHFDTIAGPGIYDVESNQYGAVSAILGKGEKLRLKLNEFEVLEWRENPAYRTERE